MSPHPPCWSIVDTPIGALRVAATRAGVCQIAFANKSDGYWSRWFEQHQLPQPVAGDSPVLDRTGAQLSRYFQGDLQRFDVPLDLFGTEFQISVWRQLCEIPFGKTVSYGELAARLGNPKASRAVGAANGANPIPIIVPCHRVIGSSGKLVGFGGGLDVKQHLLQLEGVGQTQATLF